MEASAGQVKNNGGDTVRMPEISAGGLANYDCDKGFNRGSVMLKYRDYTLTQDRGRTFSLDAMDVDELNFAASAGNVLKKSAVHADFNEVFVRITDVNADHCAECSVPRDRPQFDRPAPAFQFGHDFFNVSFSGQADVLTAGGRMRGGGEKLSLSPVNVDPALSETDRSMSAGLAVFHAENLGVEAPALLKVLCGDDNMVNAAELHCSHPPMQNSARNCFRVLYVKFPRGGLS